MIILRLIGFLLLAAGFISFVIDGVKSIASAKIVITPLGAAWAAVDLPSLNLAQAIVERYVWPFLWDPVMLNILLLPGWVVFTALGAALYYLGRRRRASQVIANQE